MSTLSTASAKPRPRRTRTIRGLAIVTAVLLAMFVAPATRMAHASASTPATWTVLVGNESPNTAISGGRFLPGELTIDAGDSVQWQANSAELHTVTFLVGDATLPDNFQFNPVTEAMPTFGSHVYDGTSYYSSGILTTVPAGQDSGPLPPFVPKFTSYRLMFPTSGDYVYYCLVHGVMMRGMIHVQATGTAYPMTQREVSMEAAAQARAIVVDGNKLRARTQAQATMTRVMMGADDGLAMVMRFLHANIVVTAGTTVTFDNTGSMGAPHTVTIGEEPPGPSLETYRPSGTYAGTGSYSTFVPPGLKATITFSTPGTYSYFCALHDYMGMTGTVTVVP